MKIPVFFARPMPHSSHKMVQMVNEVLKLKNVTEDKQKHALMLHCVGGEVHLIFELRVLQMS